MGENKLISCGKSKQGDPKKTKVMSQEEQGVVSLAKQGMKYYNKKNSSSVEQNNRL
jgi:hypothetical protein